VIADDKFTDYIMSTDFAINRSTKKHL